MLRDLYVKSTEPDPVCLKKHGLKQSDLLWIRLYSHFIVDFSRKVIATIARSTNAAGRSPYKADMKPERIHWTRRYIPFAFRLDNRDQPHCLAKQPSARESTRILHIYDNETSSFFPLEQVRVLVDVTEDFIVRESVVSTHGQVYVESVASSGPAFYDELSALKLYNSDPRPLVRVVF